MSLQDLPPELTERIVVLLPLSDISSLRLTNKSLALKTAQKHLKAIFRTKRVELTEQQLRLFVAVTANGGLGCLLQDLTIVAPVYNALGLAARLKEKTIRFAKLEENGRFCGMAWKHLTAEELRQTRLDMVALQQRHAEQRDFQHRQEDVRLLSQALSNLAAHGASLHMLRTEVEVYKDNTTTPLLPLFGGDGKLIWASADNASHTLFASLAASNLPIRSLNLFNSDRMLRSSLSCNDLDGVDFASGRLRSSLGHLAELSCRISDESTDQGSDEETDEETAEETVENAARVSNFDGFRSLLQACSGIQKLDLARFFREYTNAANSQRILRALGESGLPCLRDLTLYGFRSTEAEMLEMLQSFGTLLRLSLRHIRLNHGSFKRVLDYCTMEAAMEELELDTLWEPGNVHLDESFVMVQFDIKPRVDPDDVSNDETAPVEPAPVVRPSKVNYRAAGYPGSRFSYRRAPDSAAGCRIKHKLRQGRTIDTSATRSWRQDMKNRLGPVGAKSSFLQPYVSPEHLWRYGR
ncbi:hypothetical protein Q7P37_001942 [Cladosporium fusiforme]